MLHRLHAHAVLFVGIALLVLGASKPTLAVPVSSGARVAMDAEANTNLLQKVHGSHCSRRYGWVLHRHGSWWHEHPKTHRHRRACRRYYGRGYFDGPYVYYRYPRIYRRHHRRRVLRRHFRKRRAHRIRRIRNRRLRRHRLRIYRGNFRRGGRKGIRRWRRRRG